MTYWGLKYKLCPRLDSHLTRECFFFCLFFFHLWTMDLQNVFHITAAYRTLQDNCPDYKCINTDNTLYAQWMSCKSINDNKCILLHYCAVWTMISKFDVLMCIWQQDELLINEGDGIKRSFVLFYLLTDIFFFNEVRLKAVLEANEDVTF